MTLPNKITLVRIIMIPLMAFFYLANFIPYGKIVALVLFIVAALTDFLDGYIARKYNMQADKIWFLERICSFLHKIYSMTVSNKAVSMSMHVFNMNIHLLSVMRAGNLSSCHGLKV